VLSAALSIGLVGSGLEGNVLSLGDGFGLGGLVLYGLGQAFYGFAIGLPCAIAAELMPMCGRIMDMVRGAQFSEQLIPGSAERNSVLEQCGLMIVPLFIFGGGGYRELFVLLTKSITVFGVNASPTVAPLQVFELAWLSLAALQTAVLVCTPCILVCLVIDVSIALLSRSLGRVNMVFEALPIKIVGGLCVVWIVLLVANPGPAFRLWNDSLRILEAKIPYPAEHKGSGRAKRGLG
jgi:flagellar biosynthesis protein FliR